MDESEDTQPAEPARTPRASFGPDRRLTAACAGGALVGLVLVFSVGDAPGRLLFALATALLAGYVVTDLVFAPRLVADRAGLKIRTPFTRADLGWGQVERIQADLRQRHGLRSVTLEIEAGDDLIVLSRRGLGEDPELVAQILSSFAPNR